MDRLIYTFSLTLLLVPFWWGSVIKVPQTFKFILLVLLAVEVLVIVAINNATLFNWLKRSIASLGYKGSLFHTDFTRRDKYPQMIAVNTIAAGLRHGLMGIMYLSICYALILHFNFQIWGFIAGVFSIMISRIIPVSVGGIGLREYVAVMVFPQIGISKELAFSTAFIMSSILILQGLLGGISYLYRRINEIRSGVHSTVGEANEKNPNL